MSPTADGRMVHTYAMQGDTAKAKAVVLHIGGNGIYQGLRLPEFSATAD